MTKDLFIKETLDGGDLLLNNEDLTAVTCATNQVYLSLFGGNNDASEWWANYLMSDENKFVSETEKTLKEIAITHNGLQLLDNSVQKDLKFLKKYFEIKTEINIINYNFIQIFVYLQKGDSELKIQFTCKDKVKTECTLIGNGDDFVEFMWLWSNNQDDVVLNSDFSIITYK